MTRRCPPGIHSTALAHFVVRLASHWPDDAIEVQTKERVAINKLSSVPFQQPAPFPGGL